MSEGGFINTFPETKEEWKIFNDIADILMPLKDDAINFSEAQRLLFLYINRGNRPLHSEAVKKYHRDSGNVKNQIL